MPDDLLGPLGDEPVPPLAPSSLLRARGQQRTRRRRAALSGAAVLAVVLAGVTAFTAAGTGVSDELRPAPFASSAPQEEDSVFSALLGPAEAGEVLGGSWRDLPDPDTWPFAVPLEGCPTNPDTSVRSAHRVLTDGDRIAGQDVTALEDAAAADERYRQTLASLRACGESSPTYRLFGEGGDTSTRTYGEMLDDGTTRPFSVEWVGRTVVTIVLQGSLEPSPELTQAAADKVREVYGDAAVSPDPGPAAAPVRADQLLDGPTLERVVGGSWSADANLREDAFPGTYACPEGATAAGSGLARSLRSADDQRVGSQVLRYPSADAATQVLDALRADVRRCPSRPEDSEDGRASVSHELVELDGSSGQRFSVRVTSRDCDDCPGRVTLVAVATAGEHLVLVGTSAVQGDLPRITDAAVARAAGTASTQPAEPADALLRPQDAERARAGRWREEIGRILPSPLLDPCGDGTSRPSDAQRASESSRSLVLQREEGGTAFAQHVTVYATPDDAARAFEEHRAAVQACPREPGREFPESETTYEVLDGAPPTGVRTLLVGSDRTCPMCPQTRAYYVVQQTGLLLSVSVVEHGEDGDPGPDPATALATAVAERMLDATG